MAFLFRLLFQKAFGKFDKFLWVIVIAYIAVTGVKEVGHWYNHQLEQSAEQNRIELLMNEEDPLTIISTDASPQTVGCGGTILIPRHITTTKPLLNVKVIRQLFFFNGVHHTRLPDLGTVEYSEMKPIDKDDIYRIKLPETLLDGGYLYSPILTYKVNDYLTITKQSPTQFFTIDCEITK